MNEEAADVVLGLLATNFRRDVDDDERRMWRNSLATVPAEVGVTAAERINETEMFFPRLAEFHAEVRVILGDRVAQAEADADVIPIRPHSPMPHCDGTRWIDGEPCPRCHGAMFALSGDRRRWLRYRAGTTTAERLMTPEMKAIPIEPPCQVEERWEEDGVAVGQLSHEQIRDALVGGYEASAGRPAPQWLREGGAQVLKGVFAKAPEGDPVAPPEPPL
jgi:hypothetical protein